MIIYVFNLKITIAVCLKYEHLVYDKHEHLYHEAGHLNEGVYVSVERRPITIRSYNVLHVIVTAGGNEGSGSL